MSKPNAGRTLKKQPAVEVPGFYKSPTGLPYLARMGHGMSSKQYYNVAKTLLFRKDLLEDAEVFRHVTLPHKTGYRPYVRGFWRAVGGALSNGDPDPADNNWKPIGQQVNQFNVFWFADVTEGNLVIGYSVEYLSTTRTRPYEFLIFIYNQESI
jgi:hypothetical protein